MGQMSYRGFKRVLGETSLERKCRWWFGITLGVLLFLSFFFSGQNLKKIIRDSDRKLGPELVTNALIERHFRFLVEEPANPTSDAQARSEAEQWNKLLEKMLVGMRSDSQDFNSYAILPQSNAINSNHKNPPDDDFEYGLLARFAQRPPAPAEGEAPQRAPWDDRYHDDKEVYQYYQAVHAESSCIICHKQLGTIQRPNLAEGDLLAVMRVEVVPADTRRDIAKYEALMYGVALTIFFLSMFLLYFIVRYVIVKPVQHLRDVSNAVREGDIDQRADIHTGDEFEELAAAFNRMLRQLLRQQDTLQDVNWELDAKIDQLAQLNLQLFEMNRLKSDFLATMSHELRTPLNSILGFSDVLGAIDSLDEKQQRYVGNIQRSGKMLLEMINDILDLAKMESGRMAATPSDFPIEAVITAQCDMARPLSERKNIDIEAVCPDGLPKMRQDQAKLQQVLNNLLSNAIKFTPEGGRIEVRVDREEHSESLESATLVLEVEDTGIGISQADQAVIFEKFRQGASAAPRGDAMTREQGGTGLGLSIVRELCRLLGGDVTVRSVSGKGSTFTVRLPWRIADKTDLDAELELGVAELTRPTLPALSAAQGPGD